MQASSADDIWQWAGWFLSPDGFAVSAKKNKRMMPAPDAMAVATSEESEEDTAARTRGIEVARRVKAQETWARQRGERYRGWGLSLNIV